MRSHVSAEKRLGWPFVRLMHSLQALAMPAEVQLALFPDFVCEADELALDFDNFREAVVTDAEIELDDEERDLLDAIDKRLGEMSGGENATLWTREALREKVEWQKIRELASKALQVFGWPVEQPPSYAHEFVKLSDASEEGRN